MIAQRATDPQSSPQDVLWMTLRAPETQDLHPLTRKIVKDEFIAN
jgi:hypothetical protein